MIEISDTTRWIIVVALSCTTFAAVLCFLLWNSERRMLRELRIDVHHLRNGIVGWIGYCARLRDENVRLRERATMRRQVANSD